MTTAHTTSARRRNTESRFTSPKSRPIMSDVCNERIPLHASFTPTRPLLTRIRLPSTCAGVPSNIAVSAATCATMRINPWITGVSRAVGHGTAMKINATGNAKWRSHAFPPADQRSKSVNVTTAKAWIQASNRHSGFAISKRRSGSSNSSAGNRDIRQALLNLRYSDLRFRICDWRPVLPPEPEKVECEKWDEPPEVVLLVHRPFATKLSTKSKPESGQEQNA